MTTVLLVGVGAAGGRAARQFADTSGVERILIVDTDKARASEVAAVLGPVAEAISWRPADRIPDDVSVVACALPGGFDVPIAIRALEAGIPFATTTDALSATRDLLDLSAPAEAAGVAIAIGCGLAPGLSDVLILHAANTLDVVDEVHVARSGVGGIACEQSVRQALRGDSLAWINGGWSHDPDGSGRHHVWFPEPVGMRECKVAAMGGPDLIVDAFPEVRRANYRLEPSVRWDWDHLAALGRRPLQRGWAACRVEVGGRRGRSLETIVYGVVDSTDVATGTVLAVTAMELAGVEGVGEPIRKTGAHGLAALVEPTSFLAELAKRGVKAAVFEGLALG